LNSISKFRDVFVLSKPIPLPICTDSIIYNALSEMCGRQHPMFFYSSAAQIETKSKPIQIKYRMITIF